MSKYTTAFCTIEGCEGKHVARGLCFKHYQRQRRHGDPNQTLRERDRTCTVESCNEKHSGRGYCSKHWQRWYHHGDPLTVKTPVLDRKCSREDCDRKHHARGMCHLHYQQRYLRGELPIKEKA